MRYWITLFALLASSLSAQELTPYSLESEWSKCELRGRVKQMRLEYGTDQRAEFWFDEKGRVYRKIVRYPGSMKLDSTVELDGHTVTFTLCGDRDTVGRTSLYELRKVSTDRSGRIVEDRSVDFLARRITIIDSFDYDATGRLVTRRIRRLDSSGQVLLTVDDGPEIVMTYEYDSNGRLVCQALGQPSDSYFWEETFRYDSTGNVVLVEARGDDGPPWHRRSFSYNEHGDVSSETYLSADRIFRTEHIYGYDDRGNWTVSVTSESGTDIGGASMRPVLDTAYRRIEYYD